MGAPGGHSWQSPPFGAGRVAAVVVAIGVAALLLGSCGSTDRSSAPTTTASTTGTEAPAPAPAPAPVPGPTGGTAPPGTGAGEGLGSVLVLTATRGFRHESIEPAAAVLRDRFVRDGIAVTVTNDAGALTAVHLADVDAVVFLSTTGDILDAAQQAALQAWVEGGGGWVGVHGALDAEYDWPFYETLAGAWFQVHPPVQEATVRVEDATHPAMVHLPVAWVRTDEWYDLRSSPRDGVHVLATVDESTYEGAVMGADHPIAWCSTVGDGQTFTTAMGHTVESWSDPLFVDHVVRGIRSVVEPGSCS